MRHNSHPLSFFRVRVIVGEVLETKKKATLYKGAFLLQSFILIVIIGSMLVMCIVGGNLIKESHVKGGGVMMDTSGHVVKVDTALSDHSLFDLAAQSIVELSKLKQMSIYIDSTCRHSLELSLPQRYLHDPCTHIRAYRMPTHSNHSTNHDALCTPPPNACSRPVLFCSKGQPCTW